MPSERAEVVREVFNAMSLRARTEDQAEIDRQIERVVSCHHPDCEVDFTRTLPDFPPARGTEAMATWLRDPVLLDDFNLEAGELVEAGDTFVVAVRLTGRLRGSEASIDMNYAYVLRFRGDKIASSTAYQTLSEALEAGMSRDIS